jgi:hypothetical protein
MRQELHLVVSHKNAESCMTAGKISYRRGPDTSGFLPSQSPCGPRGLQRSLTCYRFIMAMTREDRRRLTIGAMTSAGRDERIA